MCLLKFVKIYEKLIKGKKLHPFVIDAFLADEFIKPVVSNIDYIITSAFSDVLFYKLGEDAATQPDALIYPSVVFQRGMNFAISLDAYESKMELIKSETKVVKIIDVLGCGVYEFEQVATLKSYTNEILE